MSAGVTSNSAQTRLDVIIVGAGFSGLYMLHRCREMGLSARVLERAGDVGGTWYWNRYPGARCDIESFDYAYSFDEELVQEWKWTERYAAQPEILRYIRHVADRHDLRRDISFGVTVVSAGWREAENDWLLKCDNGDLVRATYCVMATGCLSVVNKPDFKGLGDFAGEWYHTGQWPHEPVNFNEETVAVIGTGSSGIQAIPRIAEQAKKLYVLQRTPNYSMPAYNRPLNDQELQGLIRGFKERRKKCEDSDSGVPLPSPTEKTFEVTSAQRQARYEEGWQRGGISALSSAYADFFTDEDANSEAQEFARAKIRSEVCDRETADLLSPRHHIGTKRTCVDTDYFQTYNRENVELVDVRTVPIRRITTTGIELSDGRHLAVDAIVFAIGFDAITGALTDIQISGNRGRVLSEEWGQGPRTYLGLQVSGFPNLFTITGPGSPSVLSNMLVSIEQHVDWIAECLAYLRGRGIDRIEATHEAQERWMDHVAGLAAETLYPKANSWYVGANIDGKPRTFMPYVGGCGRYRRECETVAAQGYVGFRLGRGAPEEEGARA